MSSEVFVWGLDSHGQLGLDSKQALACSYDIPIFQIACGEEHSLLLTPDGLLYAFGSNSDGRLGIGDRASSFRTVPTLISDLEGIPVAKIACGIAHSAAVTASGDLYTWGQGASGALGTGGSLSHWSPQQVSFPGGWVVLSVSCGGRHTAIILKEPNSPQKSVYMCGAGESGQLGLGRKDNELTPKKLPFDEEVITIAVGTLHTLFLSVSGKVFATGNNSSGQLGTGTRKSEKRPVRVAGLDGMEVKDIGARNQSAAISSDHRLYIWGSGVFGELLSPQRVKSAVDAQTLSLGSGFCAVIDRSGHIWTWGSNANGELGHGDTEIRLTPFPVLALREKRLRNVACGGKFIIALGEDAGEPKREKRRKTVKVEDGGKLTRSRSTVPVSTPQTPSFYRSCCSHIDTTKILELELHKEQQLRISLQKRVDALLSENEQLRFTATQSQTALIREQRESAWRTQSSLQLSSDIEKLTKRARDADMLQIRMEELEESLKNATFSKEKTQELMENSTRAAIDATKRAENSEREARQLRSEVARLESELLLATKSRSDAQRQLERNTLKAEAAVEELTRRQEDLELSLTLKTQEEMSKVEAVEKEVEYLRNALRKAVESGAENSAELEKAKARNLVLQRELNEKNDRISDCEAQLRRQDAKNKSLLEALESEVKSRASVLSRAKAVASIGPESRSFSSSFLERTMRQGEEDIPTETFRGKSALEARMDLLEQKISTLKRHTAFPSDISL